MSLKGSVVFRISSRKIDQVFGDFVPWRTFRGSQANMSETPGSKACLAGVIAPPPPPYLYMCSIFVMAVIQHERPYSQVLLICFPSVDPTKLPRVCWCLGLDTQQFCCSWPGAGPKHISWENTIVSPLRGNIMGCLSAWTQKPDCPGSTSVTHQLGGMEQTLQALCSVSSFAKWWRN